MTTSTSNRNDPVRRTRMLASALLALFVACGGDDDDPPQGDAPEYSAHIRRTAHGIPHIEALTEKGLGYGVGYAFAQDSACQLAEEVVTVNGERSLHFGPDAVYEPSGDGRQLINLQSDVYFEVLNEDGLVAATWDNQPTDVRDLVLGYARGFNRYLGEVGADGLPGSCRGKPWVREISELDLMRVMRRYTAEASGAQIIDGFFAAQPPTGDGGARPPVAPFDGAALVRRFQPTKGSNGVALGRDATASGGGLLLANPHFPWSGTFRFHQFHITLPGVVDASGVGLPGLPVVGIGHNADVAWTHTVNTSRHFTFHQLLLDPDDPTHYLVDGASVAMTSREVVVRVAGGSVAHTVWSTELGPVVVLPGLLDWTDRVAYAFGDANAGNTRMMQVWWGIDRARSLADLRDAVETSLGIPWVNTVAVDAEGTAYLGDVTPVPNLPDPETCVPELFRPLAEGGLVILDGSTARCRWVIAPGAPLPGVMPASDLPVLTRTDFVQNSNDSAWMSNPAAPLTGYPAIASGEGQPLGPRTRLGLQQIAEHLEAGERFTADRMLEIAFSNRAFHATTLLDDVLALCGGSTDPALARSCGVLDSWDGAAELDSVGWPLFRAWRRALDLAAGDGGLDYWAVPFNPSDPVGTPRGLRIDDPDVAAAAQTALVAATAELDAAGIDLERPWGEVQVATRGDREIPIHGGGGDYFNDGGDELYNTINSRPTDDGKLEPFYGSTIIMVVSFEDGTPSARGLLTYSQSSDPSSPQGSDQTDLFSRKEWIAYPYSAREIAADPELVVTRVEE